MIARLIATAAAAALAAGAAAAQAPPAPILARIFNDHAVLQRDRPIALWGRAAAGTPVAIAMNGQTATARAGNDGRWQASLPAMPAGGPYTLSVSAGGAAQQVSDVMVGDVYLCSGQSNMEFPARLSTGAWGGLVQHPDPMLRYARVEKDSEPAPLYDLKTPAPWTIIDKDSVGDASAVCFYMARALQRSLKVPVGFIDSDWGGTTIQSWISPEALATVPDYREGVQGVATLARDPAAARAAEDQRSADWWRQHDPRWAATRRWSQAGFDDSGWPTMAPAGSWKDAGIPALSGFDGVVWLRTAVTLTGAQAAGAERLMLGPIDKNDTVWINGQWIGSNGTEWFWRDYAVPAGVLHAGRNVIAIRVLGGGGLTGDPDSRKITLKDGGSVPLAARWAYQVGAAMTGQTPPHSPWEVPTSLTTLYNGMIAPIAGYGFKLVAWYQGESNVGDAAGYRVLLPLLMKDWRQRTATPALPFLVAQLAPLGDPESTPGPSGWAELRDAQAMTVRGDAHAGLAVTLDVGDRHDVHPTQKLVVGERLARAARAIAYGEAIAPGGPEVVAVTRAGADLVVRFRHVADGLRAYSAADAIGFEACAGARCRFVPGRVAGDHVVLAGAATPGVDEVRYAWADAPYVNLYNSDDLPAVPFAWRVTP